MSVLIQMRALYNELRPVQKIIADHFLGAEFESVGASIEDVAKKTKTSVASVSRFCKKLGFESFQQFKITLSRDLKYEPDTVLPIFTMDDDPVLSIRKVFSEALTNLQATERVVNFDMITTTSEKIRRTKKVYFFGIGGSGKVGALGELWFAHIGYTARSVSDPYEMIITAGHADESYNIVALSHSGSTRPVLQAAEIARAKGAFLIGITNYGKSSLASLADITLLTACPEHRVHFAQSNSMVAQSTILRALYILVTSQSRGIEERVNEIERDVNDNLRRS